MPTDSTMSWTIAYDEEDDYFHVEVAGMFHLAEHRDMITDIVAHPAWRPGMPMLVDRRRTIWTEAAYHEMANAVRLHRERDAALGQGRLAVVMASGAPFGIGRQFQLLAEGKVSSTIEIFTDVDEARRWLLSGAVDEGPT